MANRQNDKLRLLLRRFEMQNPPPEFTQEVMKEIESMADEKVYANPRLVELLQTGAVVEPPAGFTFKVINKVRVQPRVSYPPIISKKAWISVVGFVVFCLVISILANDRGGSPSTDQYFSLPLVDYLSKVSGRFIEQLFYFVVISCSVIPLLALDYYFRNKLRRSQ